MASCESLCPQKQASHLDVFSQACVFSHIYLFITSLRAVVHCVNSAAGDQSAALIIISF